METAEEPRLGRREANLLQFRANRLRARRGAGATKRETCLAATLRLTAGAPPDECRDRSRPSAPGHRPRVWAWACRRALPTRFEPGRRSTGPRRRRQRERARAPLRWESAPPATWPGSEARPPRDRRARRLDPRARWEGREWSAGASHKPPRP